jgi:hypothetical protein
MNTMFYIVCIVAVVFAADTYQKYLKMKHEKLQNQERDPEIEESLAKIEMLEERIRVLERIVTESKRDIGREIDNL